jgi:glycerophosphoryl diester phosphodiesterase
VLELKSPFTDEETERFIDIIKGYDYLDSVTFISFNYENLLKVRKILPEQSAQFLFTKMTDEIISRVIADKLDVDVHFAALDEQTVNRLHDAGIKINCWTVDDKETAERLAAMGVDYITSNILE